MARWFWRALLQSIRRSFRIYLTIAVVFATLVVFVSVIRKLFLAQATFWVEAIVLLIVHTIALAVLLLALERGE